MGTAAAVAILIRKEREIISAFRRVGAMSTENGTTIEAAHVHDGIALRRLRARAVIRPARAGGWYLDEPVLAANTRMRRKFALLALLLVIAMFILGVVRFH